MGIRTGKHAIDMDKGVLIDEHHFGEAAALERIFLISFFFLFDLLGNLAFTVAMQLRSCFVDAVSFVSFFVGEVTQYNDTPAQRLGEHSSNE